MPSLPPINRNNSIIETNFINGDSKKPLSNQLIQTTTILEARFQESTLVLQNKILQSNLEPITSRILNGYHVVSKNLHEKTSMQHWAGEELNLSSFISNHSLQELACENEVQTTTPGRHFARLATTENLIKYKNELEIKLSIVRENNEELERKIVKIKKDFSSEQNEGSLNMDLKKKENSYSLIPIRILCNVQNVSMDDILQLENLKNISEKLDNEIYAFKEKLGKTKNEYDFLKDMLTEKLFEKETIEKRYETNIQDYECLSDNIKNLMKEFNILKFDPSFMKTMKMLLDRHGYKEHDPYETYIREGLLDSDEPQDFTLINQFIEYLSIFEKLFSSADYVTAAGYAANSPRGVLRTQQVLKRFKKVTYHNTIPISTKDSPLMIFCVKIMNTTHQINELSAKLSLEIIKCAVRSDDILLTQHWLCNKSMTYSLPLGNFLLACCRCKTDKCDVIRSELNLQSSGSDVDHLKCSCVFTRLALMVYSSLNEIGKCLLCHIMLGNYASMLEIIQADKDIDILTLFEQAPSVNLFHIFSNNSITVLSLPSMIDVFLRKYMYTDIINLLKDISIYGYNGHSLMDCLLQESCADNMGDNKWVDVLNVCDVYEQFDLMEDLFSCLLTRCVLENSTFYCLTDYFG